MNKKNFKIIIFLFSVISTIPCCSYYVSAATISPDQYHIDINEQNKTVNNKLTVYASPNQNRDITYTARVVGVRKVGVGNERVFYTPEPSNVNELANWVKIINPEIVIKPGGSEDILWEITSPNKYECKSYLAAISVNQKDQNLSEDGSKVVISSEVISQIIVNLTNDNIDNCNKKTSLILKDFKTTSFLPIFNYDNIEFKSVIENNSSYIAENPKGFIEVFGLGNKITLEFNEQELDIYPNSSRNIYTNWKDPKYPRGNIFQELIYEITNFRFGIYDVRLGITKNIDTPIIANRRIIIIPWKIFILVFILLTVFFVILKKHFKLNIELKHFSRMVNKKKSKRNKR